LQAADREQVRDADGAEQLLVLTLDGLGYFGPSTGIELVKNLPVVEFVQNDLPRRVDQLSALR
jgi:hypothetical protein